MSEKQYLTTQKQNFPEFMEDTNHQIPKSCLISSRIHINLLQAYCRKIAKDPRQKDLKATRERKTEDYTAMTIRIQNKEKGIISSKF